MTIAHLEYIVSLNTHSLFVLVPEKCFVTQAICQSRKIVLSGVWATVKQINSSISLNSFKIGSFYGLVLDNHWAINCSIELLRFVENFEVETSQEINNISQSRALLFNGKYLVGKNKVQGYVKGATGQQIRRNVKEETLSKVYKKKDVGLAFPGGAGVNITLSEKFFLQTVNEFMHQTNSYYKNGINNQVSWVWDSNYKQGGIQ